MATRNNAPLTQSELDQFNALKNAPRQALTAEQASYMPGQSQASTNPTAGVNTVDPGLSRNATLMGADQLANLFGVNINREAIQGIFDSTTKAQFDTLRNQFAATEGKFSDRLFQTGATLADANRRSNAEAVATGASKGVQAAQQMLNTQGLAQQAVMDSTELAQQRNLLADRESEAFMQNAFQAFQEEQRMRQTLANIAQNVYAADTQGYVGELDAGARIDYNEAIRDQTGTNAAVERDRMTSNENINMQNLAAQAEQNKQQFATQLGVANINANATIKAAEAHAKNAGVDPNDFFNQFQYHSQNINDPTSESFLRILLASTMDAKQIDAYIKSLKTPEIRPGTTTVTAPDGTPHTIPPGGTVQRFHNNQPIVTMGLPDTSVRDANAVQPKNIFQRWIGDK